MPKIFQRLFITCIAFAVISSCIIAYNSTIYYIKDDKNKAQTIQLIVNK